MSQRSEVNSFGSTNPGSGPRSLASGSRRAQQDAAASALAKTVLVGLFLASSLATIWLLLNDLPLAGLATGVFAVVMLARTSKRPAVRVELQPISAEVVRHSSREFRGTGAAKAAMLRTQV